MNNASQQKGRKSLRPLAILLSIGCATVYYSLDQKLEFNKRQERLATVFNKENNYGMCSPAASELERWCQENYFGAKGLALRTLDKFLSEGYPTIKSDCELARHNKVFYRQHIQKFLHQLDRDEALRQELEEKVYDLEREIKMEVRRDDSGYTVSFREDESDVLYVKNFGLLKNDELLQLLFREITTGNISAVEYYQQRVEEVMESAPPLSALEENVQEDILEGFRGGDTYELLVAMAENGLEGVKLKEVYLNRERQLSQVISGNQELKMKYGQIIALSEERQRLLTENGRVEEARAYQQQRKMQQRELENLTKEITNYAQELKEVLHQKQDLTRELEKSFQKEESFWQVLAVDLMDSSILQIRTNKQIMNTTIIAEGHTHPYALAIKALKAGPSPNDKETSYRKPELVLAGLEDKWQVYSTICSQVVLEREYPRTINPASAPIPF